MDVRVHSWPVRRVRGIRLVLCMRGRYTRQDHHHGKQNGSEGHVVQWAGATESDWLPQKGEDSSEARLVPLTRAFESSPFFSRQ